MKVIIIGAGIGGLCLAQSLKRSGLDVALYERDAAPFDRRQGYRLHLDADCVSAIKEALAPELYALFEATSMNPLPYTTIMDTQFNIQRRFQTDDYSKTQHHVADGIATHLNVNRATLREILLHDLADICHWGAQFIRFETDEGGVTAHFDGCAPVHGDILVAADGAGSSVRTLRAPQARFMDSGVRAIYGKLTLDTARKVLPAHALADIFTAAFDSSKKLILGVGPVIFPMRPDLAAESLLPTAPLSRQDDYVGCIISGRKELFGDDAHLQAMDSHDLQAVAADLLRPWSAEAARVPEAANPDSFFFIRMTSSIPFELAPMPRVTLLGDAIHAMTPSLGRGANVALRDAMLLARHIRDIRNQEVSIDAGLQAYETEMTGYGFGVVRHSAEMGARLLGQDPLPGT
ncbi:FAD-dependent oxidoreductase [Bradyrhizobium sp. SSBR45G]|uniref:FAD-dependent oxidoreductase n=1 Tax=unclassified Bradyrhizobium TaxID=2631580 RepID=UPI002342BB9A|nr:MULTISPECIES: NAD(P)/FAD-dependent oxidoreductase [unclassified Bradyrhizobium]GLH76495.1 FAD-dependent oxidoreductase [Bradyrhizobium sp. SSBR45G]GLH84112.1 FAD-dependent oxidoreductase [Bradyrhizobium sp. SSBR45R]